MGTASPTATTPLNRIPSFMKRPRREIEFSSGIRLLLRFCLAGSGIRLARCGDSLGSEPGNDIGDFLIGHGPARNVVAPIGSAAIRTADDHHGAEFLVGEQSEER